MTRYDRVTIKTELLNRLRNANVISVATRGVTTTTETFSGNGILTDFTVTNTGLKNVRAVSISSIAKEYGTDYLIDLDNNKIMFNSPPGEGTNNISIQYDYGATDRIFDDFPLPKTTLSAFPRIGFDVMSESQEDTEIGGGNKLIEPMLSFVAYGRTKKETEDVATGIKNFILDNEKILYYAPRIMLAGVGPMIPAPFGETRVLQRNQDARLQFIYEN